MRTHQPEDHIHELSRLTLNLGRTLDIEQECAVFFGWLEELCELELAALFLADEAQSELRLMRARGVAVPSGARMPLGVDPWGWLVAHGAKISETGDGERLALPLLLEERVLGLLCAVIPIRMDKEVQELKKELLELGLSYFAPVVRNIQRYQRMEALVAERTAELAASEERYRDLVEHSRDIMYFHDLEGVLLSVNDAACALSGFRREELVGKRVAIFLSPDVVGEFDAYLKAIARDGEAEGIMKVVTRGGETRYWEYCNSLRTGGVPQPIARGVARDVTRRVLAERALRQRTADLKLITTLNQAYNRGADLEQLLRLFGDGVKVEYGLRGGGTYLLDDEGKHLELAYFFGNPRLIEAVKRVARLPTLQINLPVEQAEQHRRWLESDQPYVRLGADEWGLLLDEYVRFAQIPDAARNLVRRFLARVEKRLEVREMVCLPLRYTGETFGLLVLASQRNFSESEIERLVALANQLSVLLRRARLERERALLLQRSQRLASRLEKLSQAAQAIVRLVHDPEQVYRTVHEAAAQLIPAEVFVITRVDRQAGEIYSVYLMDKDGRAENIRIPLDQGLSGEVLRRGEAILEADFKYESAPFRAQGFGSSEPIRALIAVPMRIGDEIVGVISAQSYAPNAYQLEDVQPLEILAGYTAIALENVALLVSLDERMKTLQTAERRLERQLQELKTLNAAAQMGVQAVDEDAFLGQITDLLAESFYVEHCGVLLVDEAAKNLRVHPSYRNLPPEFLDPDYRMPLGVGVAGKVLASGKPFRSGDVRAVDEFIETTPGIRSELCVPIQVGDERLGVINVESMQPDAFDEQDERFLTTLAGTVATALKNLRLLAAEKRRAARLEALLNLTAELDLLQSPAEVADLLVERVKTLAGCATSALLERDSRAEEVVLIAQRGLPAKALERRYRLDLPELRPLLGGEALFFADVFAQAPELAAVLSRKDLKSIWMYPLMLDGAFRGVLVLGDTRARLPSVEEVAAYRLLADRVAAKLENLRFLSDARQHAKELETLHQVSLEITAATALPEVLQRIALSARVLADADDVHIFLYEDEQLRFGAAEGRAGPVTKPFSQPRPDGLTARVARSGERIVIPSATGHELYRDYTPPFAGAIAGFPLISGKHVIGVFNVAFEEPHVFEEHDLYLLELLATQAAVAIEQANLLELTSRRAAEMEALVEALQALGGTLDLDILLKRILGAAIRAIPAAEKGTLSLRVGEDELEFRAVWGYRDSDLVGRRYSTAWGYAGRALRQGRSLVVEDVRADPELLQASQMADIQEARTVISAAVVPLMVKGEVLGVMSLDNATRPGAFTQDDLRLLTSFAQQAALAIESSRLYEETRRRLAELDVVNRVSVALREATTVDEMTPLLLDEILKALDTTAGSILLHDALSGDLVAKSNAGWLRRLPDRLPPGEGMAGRAFSMEETLTAPDLKKENKVYDLSRPLIPPGWAGAAVPILTADERLGVIEVAVPAPRVIDENDIRLLRILAEIAGNAIHRMRLHEQTEQRLRHLVALRRVDQAISSSMKADWPLILLLGQLEQQLGIAAADVLTVDPELNQWAVLARRGLLPQVELLTSRRRQLLLNEIVVSRRQVVVSGRAQAEVFFPGQAEVLFPADFDAYMGFPLIAKGKVIGVLEMYFRHPARLDEESQAFIDAAVNQAALAIDNARLFEGLQRANIDLKLAYDSTLEGWARALELRDRETKGHSERVVELTLKLARRLGVEEAKLVHIRRGALLHDIGKVGVPDAILHKTGPLTEEEWAIMRQHPVHAYEMLKSVEFLRPALEIPYAHHERWDGSGYPRGLKGEQIPLAARIFAVVDIYDALINERPYRKAWTKEQALEYIRQEAGKTLDPRVVEAFLALVA